MVVQVYSTLPSSLIWVCSAGTDYEQFLREWVHFLKDRKPELDHETVLEALLKREHEQKTTVGKGFALPHALGPFVDTLILSAALVQTALPVETPDDVPLHTAFLILAPRSCARDYLRYLAHLARIIKMADPEDWTTSVHDPEILLKKLTEIEKEIIY